MTDQAQIEYLVNWASTFDPSLLQSEDDVETKFVLPFFKLLGYPETYRRGKHPVDDYQPGKRGRRSETDHIYFSTDDPTKQNADTALLLIEAKKVQEDDLKEAIKQARHYGEHLKTLFLVITNGIQIKVLKRLRYQEDETIFDITVDQLRDRTQATKVYNQLQFETVQRIKEQASDPLRHTQYVEIMRTLDRYPDVQAQLAKGDFELSTVQEGRHLTVVKPKVAITCELPIAFAEGRCTIKFSNIMLRGLTCRLSHAEILTDFLIGLETPPDWETRPFLYKTEQNTFEARLGETTVILSECEADELCNAVDEVCKQYKKSMIETTNTLETWDFRLVKIEDEKGFEMLSVEPWLWEKMKQFSQEFDYDNGNSEWHIFDSHSGRSIRVCPKNGPDHVVIWPRFGGDFFLSKAVDLLYVDCITYLYLYEETAYDSTFKNVGPRGVWTASYTKEWLKQQFVPRILSYYSINQSPLKHTGKKLIERIFPKIFPSSKLSQKQREAIVQEAIQDYSSAEDIPLVDISEPKQFAPYLHKVQSLFHHYHVYGTHNVSASFLRSYYAAFTELARCADPTTVDVNYIRGNLGAVRIRTEQDEENVNSRSNLSTYTDALTFLDKQVVRIQAVNYEDHKVADLLSSTFIAIIQDGTLQFQQSQVNAAKDALYPLWELCHFNDHFIDPILSQS